MALFPNAMPENGIKNNTIPPLPPGIGGIFAFKACRLRTAFLLPSHPARCTQISVTRSLHALTRRILPQG